MSPSELPADLGAPAPWQHTEPRVRSLAIELLGLLAQKDGVQAYLGMRERLLGTVKAHLRPLGPEEVSKIDSKGTSPCSTRDART